MFWVLKRTISLMFHSNVMLTWRLRDCICIYMGVKIAPFIYFLFKKGFIIYLLVLKEGNILHAHPYYEMNKFLCSLLAPG